MQQSFVRLTVGGQDTIGFVTPETLAGEKKSLGEGGAGPQSSYR
jgi:hypothetical protein